MNNSDLANTYQWYFSAIGYVFNPISGATASTYTTSLPGLYYVIIKNGSCEVKSNTIQTCPIILTNASNTVCFKSTLNIPFRTYEAISSSTTLTLQLIDPTSGNVVNSNLSTFFYDINKKSFDFTLPNSVTSGTYKFKIISSSPAILSPISDATLTVLPASTNPVPVITVSQTSFSSPGTNINLSAAGCIGITKWEKNDQPYLNSASIFATLFQTTIFSAVCGGTSGGCAGLPSQITVTYNCTDALEPNNTAPTATPIATDTYNSPTICLDGYSNEDWFSWVYNGKTYYIVARLFNINTSAGQYQFKLTQTGTSLVVETLPISAGQYLNTNLRLFDSDATTLITSNSGGNSNGFSKITYTLPNLPNPCPSVQNLVSPTNDIAAGQTKTIKGVAITATNKVANTAIVDYRGQNTIMLNPGFETQISSGGTFKAQVKGCIDTSN